MIPSGPGPGRGRRHRWARRSGDAGPPLRPSRSEREASASDLTGEEELRMLEEEELMLRGRLDEVSRRIGTLRNQIQKEVK